MKVSVVIKSLFIIFLAFFLFAQRATSASLEIQPVTSQIHYDQELSVDLSYQIQAASGTSYYLRGVFGKEGSSNYCGITWNGNEWFEGPYSKDEGWKNFLNIEIQNSSWSGQLKAKVNTQDAGCRDTGEYIFRIQRFTQSGSGNFDSQNEVKIMVVIPTATPTPQPTQVPTKEPTPTVASQKEILEKKEYEDTGKVLSVTTTHEKSVREPSPTKRKEQSTEKKSVEREKAKQFVAGSAHDSKKEKNYLFIICGGAILLICCGILLYKFYREKRQNEGVYLNE